MISETRFLSGGYSTFITTSNRWNIWADDNFVSQICRVCETNFCSWHRLIVLYLGGKSDYLSLTPCLLPGNLFSPLNPGEWVPVTLVLGTQRRKFLNCLLFHSPHAFMGWWWGGGSRNCSLGSSPHGSRRGDCDIVMTLGVEMIWMVKGALTIKHLFCFLLGALSPAKYRGIFLDLHWLFSS